MVIRVLLQAGCSLLHVLCPLLPAGHPLLPILSPLLLTVHALLPALRPLLPGYCLLLRLLPLLIQVISARILFLSYRIIAGNKFKGYGGKKQIYF